MTIIAEDAFTDSDDTLLTAHTPTTGTSWQASDASAIIRDNSLSNTDFGGTFALISPGPDTPDYFVGATMRTTSSSPAVQMGVCARMTYDGLNNGYGGGWFNDDTEWQIWRFDTSLRTVLASSATPALDPDTDYLIELGVEADHLTLRVDGVLVCEAFDSTYEDASFAGVRVASLVHDWLFLDDFYVSTEGTGGEDPTVLEGRGELELVNLGWLSLAVTGITIHNSVGTAQPPNYFHVGMLSLGGENGYMTAFPLTRELELVKVPEGITRLGYYLVDGIAVTVTEVGAP